MTVRRKFLIPDAEMAIPTVRAPAVVVETVVVVVAIVSNASQAILGCTLAIGAVAAGAICILAAANSVRIAPARPVPDCACAQYGRIKLRRAGKGRLRVGLPCARAHPTVALSIGETGTCHHISAGAVARRTPG